MGGSSSHRVTAQMGYVRYAPYIESQHQTFLSLMASYRNATVGSSPFSAYVNIEVEDAFFGSGYSISNFPSLYDMYGKFMAGLDVEALYDEIFEDATNSPVVSDLVAAEGSLMDDDIAANSIPRMTAGMRDINSVMSSSFVIGKAAIEDTRTKALSKFSAELKYRLIPVATQRWTSHLDWNKMVVSMYSEVMKLYYSAKTDVDEFNYAMAAKDVLWPFTVLDFERAALGALQGAVSTKTDVAGASTASKVLSGALSGAAMGATIGQSIGGSAWGVSAGGWGAGIGAALGIAAALTY